MLPRTACLLLLAAPAAAQPTLYALRANGDLLRLDPATGGAQTVGSSGVSCRAGGSRVSTDEWVYSAGDPAHPARVARIDRFTGAVTSSFDISGLPAGYTPRNVSSYAILHSDDPQAPDLLARLDYALHCQVVGPTGRRDLEAAAYWYPNLYAIGPAGGGTLYTLSPTTGAATAVGSGNYGDSYFALAFTDDGSLLACGSDLLRINAATGAATVIGPTGVNDIRALAPITRRPCYANCDGSFNPPPPINVLDFNCFLARFAAGDPYANCDESTTPPTLNVLDFNCFLYRFVTAGNCL
jgi:hypothetical protein